MVAPLCSRVVPTRPVPCSVAPPAMLKLPPSWLWLPIFSVPLSTFVWPANALLLPVKLSCPASVLLKLPLPESTPA